LFVHQCGVATCAIDIDGDEYHEDPDLDNLLCTVPSTSGFPVLEKLSLSGRAEVLKQLNLSLEIKRSTTPSLCIFHLNGGRGLEPTNLSDIPIVFELLISLSLDNLSSLDEYIQTLKRCHSAERVFIHLQDILYPPPSLMELSDLPINLPALKSLSICSFMGITGLLDHFSIPSLEELQVVFQWDSFNLDKPRFTLSDYPTWPHTAFTSFIRQSACSITSLHFMDVHLSCQELCDVIHCTNTSLE
jgi:hypothetical protein